MEAEARYTVVGATVLLLVMALVGSLLWLKGVGGRGEFNHYAIYFERQALDGLDVGSDVNMRGIKVGRVQDYALSNDKLNRVRVHVRIDRRTSVRTNTVALITRNLVTGIAAILLVNPEPPGAPLTAVPEGDDLPVIGEGQSDLDAIAGRVSRLGEQAHLALANVNQLLSTENRRIAIDTVAQLRDLAAGLNQRLTALDGTLGRASDAAASIGHAADQLGQAGDRVAAIVEREGDRLDTTLVQTGQALADARAALERVTRSVEAVERQAGRTASRLEASATHVDDQLSAAVSELRLSMESANRVLDRLSDPRAALLGPGRAQLGPGEAAR